MKIGEIKAQALMLMGVNNTLDITWSDIEGYKEDPTYATYIYAMTGSINRCLKRLYMAGALEREPFSIQTGTTESEEISGFAPDISDAIAEMIPLYVVGDIYALEEPSVAQNKRNEFEALLEEYMNKRSHVAQDEIDVIYGV